MGDGPHLLNDGGQHLKVQRVASSDSRGGMMARSLFWLVLLALLATILFRGPAVGSASDTPLVLQSASPSPTDSVSPTPSASPSPDPNFRRVTLSSSRRHVRVGARVTFTGAVIANRVECRSASRVTLRRVILGTSNSLVVARRRTDAEGRFRFRDTVRWSALYYAVVDRQAGCRRKKSDPEPVFAHVWFKVRVSDATPARDTNFRVSGRVHPNHSDTRVLLQVKRRKRWRSVQRQELSSRSSFSFSLFANWAGRRVIRVKWPKGDRDHEKATSRPIIIRTHA
jgi:hypothetical protein